MENNDNNHISNDPIYKQDLRTKSLKLSVWDWLEDTGASITTDLVEVQFKNTRKGYFRNTNKIELEKGMIVAVESNPGHDIGVVTLIGELVKNQIRRNNIDISRYEIRRIYRVAKPNDIEKWEAAKAREHKTMIDARQIALDLGLNMKIGDVEYQGDGNKAIFYYIADERVDFRQLIKVLADRFRVRIEMKQIGARQEAGRIGGIGPCGRELCCASWMNRFVSVSTNVARYQELTLNPQKLAGQCAKLKCCLNYEIDGYVEAQRNLPDRNIPLQTKKGNYFHFKTDVYSELLTYAGQFENAGNLVCIPAERVREVLDLNRRGIIPDSLDGTTKKTQGRMSPNSNEDTGLGYQNVVGQDDLTRFDNKNKRNNPSKNRNRNKNRKFRNNQNRNDQTNNNENDKVNS